MLNNFLYICWLFFFFLLRSICSVSLFIDWVICFGFSFRFFFKVKCFEFFLYTGVSAIYEMQVTKIFSHSLGSHFMLLIFALKVILSSMLSHLLTINFTSSAFQVLLRKSVPETICCSVGLTFSSSMCSVSSLISRFGGHVELSFMHSKSG